MSVVRFNLEECDHLIEAQRSITALLHDSISQLAPTVIEAQRALEFVPHPNYSPLAGFDEAADGLTADRRDLQWRVEFVRRMDGSGFDGPVSIAAMPDWTYEQANAWYLASDIDELWDNRGDITTLYEAQHKRERLHAMIAEYIGTDDPDAIAAVVEGLAEGEQLVVAVQRSGVRMQQAAHIDRVTALGRELDLSFEDAEALWFELETQIATLHSEGFSLLDAADAVFAAQLHDLDIGEVADLASAEGIGLVDAITLELRAAHYDMTVPQLIAYDGLGENFTTFDNASGGEADGLVSLNDLRFVTHNPDNFTAAEVASAAALLAHMDLLARLDTGRDNNDILNDGDSFGDNRFDDGLISRADIEGFEWKQGINAIVGEHYDEIDNIHGGELDGHLSKADFETFLRENRNSLTDDEITALEIVIDGELYDKAWLERNKRSLAIAAAVVAGAAIGIGTGGLGSGISGALITAVVTGTGGAAFAGATTLSINGLSSESDWDDDLVSNMGHGFLGGMGGGGLGVAQRTWSATSGASRFALASGTASDATAIVGMGGTDWALDVIPGVDHEDLEGLHNAANATSLVLGVTGLGAAGIDGINNVRQARAINEAVDALDPMVIERATSFTPDGVPPWQARAWLETADGRAMLNAAEASQLAAREVSEIAAFTPADWIALRKEASEHVLKQIGSGAERPMLAETHESLFKLVPNGQNVSEYSPFWMTRDELDDLLRSRRDIADALGLPYNSHADEYAVWRIDPLADEAVTVFSSEIAPTSEIGGLLETQGGVQQVLVPNRSLYEDAVIEVGDPIVSRTNGGLLAPVREAATVTHSTLDDALPSPRSTESPLVDLSEHTPTINEELVDANS